MKKIFLFLIIFGGFFFISLVPGQAQAAGLVPCGGRGEDPCQLCHIFVLFQKIVNFLLFPGGGAGMGVVPSIAVLMIVIGGFMFFFAGQNPGLLTKAKSLLNSVLIGLLIIYGAWVFINLFFMLIGVQSWTGLEGGWWQIDCAVL